MCQSMVGSNSGIAIVFRGLLSPVDDIDNQATLFDNLTGQELTAAPMTIRRMNSDPLEESLTKLEVVTEVDDAVLVKVELGDRVKK